jgi:protein-S-isoprenylcysteine O-methyltransferase Ste14
MSPSPSSKAAEPAPPTTQAERRPWWLIYGDIVFFLGLYLFAVWRCHGIACLSGIALGFPSFVLWFMAKLNLGQSFTLSVQARHLVTQGLYSRIRHPIYFCSTLALLATALCLHNLFFYLYVIAVVGVQLWRIRAEERVLTERFGEAYREYRERTWF